MGLQVGSGSVLPASVLTGPDVETVPTDTAVSRLTVKQHVQTRTKVGRRRVVTRFDVRPQRPLVDVRPQRPVQQPVSRSWLDTTCNLCPPGVSSHQLEHAVTTGSDVADVKDMTALLGNGD